MEDSAKLRLVRCPKCQNLLPELADYSVYKCGGCGAVLRAKLKGKGSDSMWEASDERHGGGDSAKSENSLGKLEVDVYSNGGSSREDKRDLEKPNKGERFLNHSKDGSERGVLENDSDVHENKEREKKEQKSQMGGSQFYGRTSNWPNGERGEMEERFWRKPPTDMEGVRFSALNYPDEGTSSSYSTFSHNYGEQVSNYKDMDGVNRVQHLEQERAELLRKLNELTNQLNQSSEAANNPKEKFLPDGKIVSPDPYNGPGPDTWFPDGLNRTSRQVFVPNKHMAGPPYFNYGHDPYAYTNGHDIPMNNLPPSMYNPNYIPEYGDPFVSQTTRGSHLLSHQFSQRPMYPCFPGRYAGMGQHSYEPYAHNAVHHPPSCSCIRCYENNSRGSVPAPPAAFVHSRFPQASSDPMLFRNEIRGAVGPHVPDSRTSIPAMSLHERPLHTRWPRDLNSEMGGFVRSHPRKVMPASGSRHCHPIAGGSPFITCRNCFELLQLPRKTLLMMKNRRQNVRCGSCSSEINFAVISKKLVISLHSEEMKKTTTGLDDNCNEVVNSHLSHSHGHVNTNVVKFSSDDYSGYDFHSVDRESPGLAADPSLNSSMSPEMQNLHSSSPSTSEDENSPDVMIAPDEATKSINNPTKASSLPLPAGSSLQEYFDYSSNNHVANRFEKGNRSTPSEQEKTKTEKKSSRKNSLKEVVLASEMDVHDYSNTGVSQDSGDVSREHDHPRSNKGGESIFSNIIKKGFREFSHSNQNDDGGKSNVTVNGEPIPDRVIKKAEKLAGPIQPGNYWYDFQAGFWGVMGGPCLGIIPPFIEEFNYPMPGKCAGGDTSIFVNGRELHQKDLDLLARRGLPNDSNRSYIVEISGRVIDEDTGEELDSLGKLAPTVEKTKHGFGMKVPRAAAA